MNKSVKELIGISVAGAAAFGINKLCDRVIKRSVPSDKPEKPETREAYIERAEARRRNNDKLMGMNPENLSIKSVDGLDMRAWFVPAEKPSKKFVICVHGYRCNGPDEMSHFLPFYHYDLGFNYLLPDLTAHGRSEGEYIGFGSFDAKNILLWIDYLINRFGEDIQIVLHGISMGAATVMNCNEMSPPNQVEFIIEDCGFTSAKDVINKEAKNMVGFPVPHLMMLVSLCSKIKAGYFFSESDPLGNMDKAKNPVLFVHGEDDTFVPFEYGKKLYEACPTPKDYYWVPNTVHAFSYYNAPEGYEEKIRSFVDKYMDNEETE